MRPDPDPGLTPPPSCLNVALVTYPCKESQFDLAPCKKFVPVNLASANSMRSNLLNAAPLQQLSDGVVLYKE